MAVFIVCYDERSGQDYERLRGRLKEFGTYWHRLDSTWLVRTNMDAKQLRDELERYMYANDRLLVMDVTGQPAAWAGFAENAGGKWLKENL
jgi:hypothetical protein